jgi:hypothetical protein
MKVGISKFVFKFNIMTRQNIANYMILERHGKGKQIAFIEQYRSIS